MTTNLTEAERELLTHALDTHRRALVQAGARASSAEKCDRLRERLNTSGFDCALADHILIRSALDTHRGAMIEAASHANAVGEREAFHAIAHAASALANRICDTAERLFPAVTPDDVVAILERANAERLARWGSSLSNGMLVSDVAYALRVLTYSDGRRLSVTFRHMETLACDPRIELSGVGLYGARFRLKGEVA